jgi:hypothetical protein
MLSKPSNLPLKRKHPQAQPIKRQGKPSNMLKTPATPLRMLKTAAKQQPRQLIRRVMKLTEPQSVPVKLKHPPIQLIVQQGNLRNMPRHQPAMPTKQILTPNRRTDLRKMLAQMPMRQGNPPH